MTRNTSTVILAVLLATSLVAPVAAASSMTTIDTDHDLTTDAAIQAYETDGVATTTIAAPEMRITVSKSADAVDLSGWTRADVLNSYLRIQYNESVNREIRFFVPNDYFRPRVKQDLEAEHEDVTVDLEPAADYAYTSVTIELSGPTDARFAIGKEAGMVFTGRETAKEQFENGTGYEVPSLRSPAADWQYVEESRLQDENTTYAIPTNDSVAIQYDTAATGEEENWIPVPECDRKPDAAVCQYTRDGVDDKVFIMTTEREPPAVRYKEGGDSISSIEGVINDLQQIPSRFMDDITGLLGVQTLHEVAA